MEAATLGFGGAVYLHVYIMCIVQQKGNMSEGFLNCVPPKRSTEQHVYVNIDRS